MTNRALTEILRRQVPLTMRPDATLREAARAMADRGVGAVLVTDAAGCLLGIVTGRDAVRALAEAEAPGALTLDRVMTRNPATLGPDGTAIEALRLMADCGCRHIPVVAAGKVAGIVSRGDFRGLELDRLDEETGLWERIA
ncbi:MAG: CBS domain-containing protein [Rhodospirillales bacterium]|nr:CBS domain-containing protein [Rhodospirillales bacterium]